MANSARSHQLIIFLALAALLALGLWLRLRFIHAVQLYPDEFVSLLAIQMIRQKGLPVMPSGLFYDHGLLFSYLGSLATGLGPAHLAARYASLLAGMLTMGLTFWLGRRWFSPAVGLMAVAGLAVSPAAIEWSGRVRMYALLQLLVLLTLWLAYEGITRNKTGYRWAALLAYLAAVLTHFVAVTLAPPLMAAAVAVWWLQKTAGEQGSKGAGEKSPPLPRSPAPLPLSKGVILEIAALAAILIISFLVKRAGQPKGLEAMEAATTLPGLAQVFSIYSDFSFNPLEGWQAISPFYLTLPALIFAPFALLAVITSLITFFTPLPPRSPAPQLFLATLLLLTTLEMILFVSPDRRDDKYLFMLLPALFLLGAQGMAQLGVSSYQLLVSSKQLAVIHNPPRPSDGQSTLHPLSSILLPLLVSSLIIMLTQPTLRALLANTGDDYNSAFAYVQANWQPDDQIFSGTPAAAVFYLGRNDFYGVQRRGGYDYRLLTVNGQAVDRWLASPAVRTETELHQVLARHDVWLVLERWGLQREYYGPAFLQQLLAQTDYVSESQGIFILHSKDHPQPLALNPAYPVEANFGNLLQLIGYTIEPARSTPGQSLRLTLYWQPSAPLLYDYTVFVHLRRPNGENVAQSDHRPLENLYPTSVWPVGEVIRESSQLNLPPDLPPGEYELWVGLYRLETGQRLPVQNDTSGENGVFLGPVGVMGDE